MGARKVVRRPRRKICIGDLNARICLQKRTLTEPTFGQAEFGEDFEGESEVWAAIRTTAGKVFFDGVNRDVNVTHEVFIRYDPTVTTETWVELRDGRRLDIVNVENLEERHEYLRLLCTDRGSKDKGATSA